jgi:putative acetyltransferase
LWSGLNGASLTSITSKHNEEGLMIREFQAQDIDAVLAIWLQASCEAHDFIEPAFWQSKVDDMRNIYLPASEVYVYEHEEDVVGFVALYQQQIAALFVTPGLQGQGIGRQLLDCAKQKRQQLTLSVYKDNQSAYQFYLAQGFEQVSEQAEPHTGCSEYVMQLHQ